MGFLTKLALLPLAPAFGVVSLARMLERQAEEQFYGEANIRRELFELELAYEWGDIEESEYLDAEAALLQRLDESRLRRQEGWTDGSSD